MPISHGPRYEWFRAQLVICVLGVREYNSVFRWPPCNRMPFWCVVKV